MFSRFSNSWKLVKASAEVLRADKELILFPIISMIGVLIVTVSFILPMFLAGLFEAVTEEGGQVLGIVVAFLYYVVLYCVIFFANTALVGAALIRLDGGDPTVRDGFRIASQRLGTILGYALISATVGMVLRLLRDRGGILGQITSALFELSWNLATFLVVPVLVVENVGPIEAVKRSAKLLKKTWGEQIAGNLSIGLIFFAIGALLVLVGIPLVLLAIAAESVLFVGLAILLVVLALVTVALIGSTLNGIYSAAVYRYVDNGSAGDYFSTDMVQGAFRSK
jgi:hypothetical protein